MAFERPRRGSTGFFGEAQSSEPSLLTDIVRRRLERAYPKRAALRALAFAASAALSFAGAEVTRASISVAVATEIDSTAASKAAWLAREGSREPLTFRTNWSAASWISALLAGGSKL